MAKISIIIPVYNTENYLERCLDSVVNQSFEDIEIIIVNDGSQDKSQNIIDSYVKKDKRIISINKENGGLSSARNAGLEVASGDYIGFVDSDDWININMYQKLYKIAKKEKCDIVVTNYLYAYDKNYIVNDNIFDDEVITLNDNNRIWYIGQYLIGDKHPWSCCCRLYKKDLLFNNNIRFDLAKQMGEDVPFAIETALHANKICTLSEQLYFYYQSQNSIMRSDKKNIISDYSYILDLLQKKINEKDVTNLVLDDFNYILLPELAYIFSTYIINWNNGENKGILNIKSHIKEIKRIKDVFIKINNQESFNKLLIISPKMTTGKNLEIKNSSIICKLLSKEYYILVALTYYFCLKMNGIMRRYNYLVKIVRERNL